MGLSWVGLRLGLGLDRKSKNESLFLIIEKIIFECFFEILFIFLMKKFPKKFKVVYKYKFLSLLLKVLFE